MRPSRVGEFVGKSDAGKACGVGEGGPHAAGPAIARSPGGRWTNERRSTG